MATIDLERHPFELHVLNDVAKALTARLPLTEMLSRAMDRLNASLGPADVGILYLWDDREGCFRAAASFGCDHAALSDVRLRPGESVAGKVFLEGRPRLFATAESITTAMDDVSPANRRAICRAIGTELPPLNILAAPLRGADESIGVLLLYTVHSAIRFTLADLPFVQMLADLLALAIARSRLEEADEVVREVRRADRLRAEIMATLTHELRTPLAAIRGYATAMMMDDVRWPKWKRTQFLRQIDEECENLQAMISEIQDSALLDIGQLTIEPQPLRLPHLLTEVASRDAAPDPRAPDRGRRTPRVPHPGRRPEPDQAGCPQHPGQCHQVLAHGRPGGHPRRGR